MLLTITSSASPATDLGYLLHKNPDRVHVKELAFGVARVCYPEASDHRCTAALIGDIDPVELVRGRRGGPKGNGFSLSQYVNDRPYAASSFMSVAINKLFGTAMTGRSKDRPELADQAIPLTVHLPVLPCRGGDRVLRALFEPLGYEIESTPLPLDDAFPQWGASRYLDASLSTVALVQHVLEHLFVLLPVLDDDKHYWVGDDEVDKLLRRGGQWLGTHPERELITRRYLRHDRRLTRDALARLIEADGSVEDPDEAQQVNDAEEAAIERPVRLNDQRMAAVVSALCEAGAQRIADLGCGQGTLVRALLHEPWVDRVVGIDVSWRSLETAARRLRLDEMPPRQRGRVDLWQGALTYRDRRLRDFDAVAVVEVIEHIDPPRLAAFEDSVFGDARPRTAVVTTPNVEYNARFEGLAMAVFTR
ncbi:MAG: 3' terminal RNA ribose 2'-O-methyltransferase Hen1 [Actinobacteria bacterium]|nr:3' terminal RNA ribose 2'-O-methyltransferase Hen1 [Actinomycetota bacterium]